MVSITAFRAILMSFEGTEELPHFERTSFRVKKKIVATLDLKNNRACLKLSLVNQSVFTAFDSTAIYPVPNAWGKQGWTIVELKKVRKDLLQDALSCAYDEVTRKKKK